MQQINIFHKNSRIMLRDRLKNLSSENPLQEEVAERFFIYLQEFLKENIKKSKPIEILDIGSKSCNLFSLLRENIPTLEYEYADISHKLAMRFVEALHQEFNAEIMFHQLDEEGKNWQINKQYDTIISMLNVSTLNNLPAFFENAKKHLKTGGVFLTCLLNSGGLAETASKIQQIEEAHYKAITPRFHPQIDVKDAARLMQTSSLQDPFAASEKINIEYEDIKDLFLDLKEIGESNTLSRRKHGLAGKEFMQKVYDEFQHGTNITLEMIVMGGIKK